MSHESKSSEEDSVPRSHLVAFVVVTFGVSVAVAAATISETVGNATTVPIMLTPALTAIVLRRLEGRSVRRTVVESLRGVTGRSMLFAVAFPVLFIAVVALVALGTGLGTFTPGGGVFSYNGPFFLFPIFLVIIGVITYGEELGWRGYLLPELAERVSPVAATAIVGVVWALYHAPALYFGAQATGLNDPVTATAIQMGAVFTVASFPVAYSYFLSNGSVLPPLTFHVVWNLLNPWVLGNVYTNVEGFVAGQVILISGEGLLGLFAGTITLVATAFLIYRRSNFGDAINQSSQNA